MFNYNIVRLERNISKKIKIFENFGGLWYKGYNAIKFLEKETITIAQRRTGFKNRIEADEGETSQCRFQYPGGRGAGGYAS